jgi:hypothetical protein
MSDLMGMGTPDWLPRSVVKRQLEEERLQRKAAREEEARLASDHEARHQRALTLYKEQAEARGEEISVLDMAQGLVTGRSVGDILRAAEMASDAEDARQRAREAREGTPPPVHINFDEPVIHVPVSPVKRSIATRSRHFFEAVAARRAAEAAQAKVDADLSRQVRRSLPFEVAAAPSGPPQCTRARYDRNGYCGCLACANFETEVASRGSTSHVSYRAGFGGSHDMISRDVDARFVIR